MPVMPSATVEPRSNDLDDDCLFSDHGLDLGKLVELRGFEPLTPSMRTERSGQQNRCSWALPHVRAFEAAAITASGRV